MPHKPERVLAFDPGFERLGVAVIERGKEKDALLFSACLRTSKTLPYHERLGELGAAVEKIIVEWQPDAVAIEKLYFENNAKTAIAVAGACGMLAYLAAKNNLPLFEYTPLQVKAGITGYGQSDKKAVAFMVEKIIALPLALDKKRLDDELDAIAVGITCLAVTRSYPHAPVKKVAK
jgi:crossover junction endodeoxyribonuclease RuvC